MNPLKFLLIGLIFLVVWHLFDFVFAHRSLKVSKISFNSVGTFGIDLISERGLTFKVPRDGDVFKNSGFRPFFDKTLNLLMFFFLFAGPAPISSGEFYCGSRVSFIFHFVRFRKCGTSRKISYLQHTCHKIIGVSR